MYLNITCLVFMCFYRCSLLMIMTIASHLDTFHFSCNKGWRLKPPPSPLIQTCEFVHPEKKDLNQMRFLAKLMCEPNADRLMDMDSCVCVSVRASFLTCNICRHVTFAQIHATFIRISSLFFSSFLINF